MRVEVRNRPENIPLHILELVEDEITASLKAVETEPGRFIINDTHWFKLNAQGKPTPCVMNAAEFISRKFETYLRDTYGWQTQFTSDAQRIDGYKPYVQSETSYYISRNEYRKLIIKYWEDHPEENIEKAMREVKEMYIVRRKYDIQNWEEQYRLFFTPASVEETSESNFNAGLEFETGNIASAFRSFLKLSTLYEQGVLDLGVFVTTVRAAAHRIWPVSNRNVTYEELVNRRYKNTIKFPVIEFVFQPDDYSAHAAYLHRDGTTYTPQNTGQKIEISGVPYQIYIRGAAEQILLPIDPTFSIQE